MLKRYLDLKLPKKQSLFLWGARKTGKSTYLKSHYPDSLWIDLLKNDTFLRYNKQPHLLREEILSTPDEILEAPIIIDEIQKIPSLLDEIHWLIENGPKNCSFILCGSSLRRLKHEGANLLGGRTWRQVFLPLCFPEIKKFDLLRTLNHGLLPAHYLNEHQPKRLLEGYLADYLIPEVQWESRVRQLGAFGRFLEAIAYSNGEIVNYSNIGREAGVSVKTIQSYVELLLDMLVGYLIFPYAKSISRQLITSAPKFYFFDTGIVRALKNNSTFTALKGPDVGHAVEHYIFLELLAYKELTHADFDIKYWRTKSGIEVDFILKQGTVAIEVKTSQPIEKKDIRGLIEFSKENKTERRIMVSFEPRKRMMSTDNITIEVFPIEEFLENLWAGKIC